MIGFICSVLVIGWIVVIAVEFFRKSNNKEDKYFAKDKLKIACQDLQREYICCVCAQETCQSEFIALSASFCPKCGGSIRVNTEKIWCYADKNGKMKGPFYDAELRNAFVHKEIYEQTEIVDLLNLECKPLSGWMSLESVLKPVSSAVVDVRQTPCVKPTIKPLLVSCEPCSHQFSKRAKACPKCGWLLLEICQVCQHKIPSDSISCPECGDPKPFGENHSTNLQIDSEQKMGEQSNTSELFEHERKSTTGEVSWKSEQQAKTKRKRKVTATIVCALLLFLYHFIVSGPLVGWKHGGGAIPNVLLWVVLFVIWFSITKVEDKS